MRWSESTRAAISRLVDGGRSTDDPRLRVVLSACRRADESAAGAVLSALGRSRRRDADAEDPRSDSVSLKQALLMPVGDRCNLACAYCYESGRRRDAALPVRRMTSSTLESVLGNLLPYVADPFLLSVHGGEPLLAGKEFFERLGALVRAVPAGDRIEIGVQTNGTLIDREWAGLFRRWGMTVGLSLDGPAEVHDAVRKTAGGEGTHADVLRAIGRLEEAGVPFGAIAVVDARRTRSPSAGADLLRHFRELGITSFDFHPAYSHDSSSREWNLGPVEFASFATELFECWLSGGNPDVRIRFFDHFFEGMTGHGPFVCYLSGSCTTVLGIAPDGETLPCTRPFQGAYAFGNLAQRALPEILGGEAFRRFQREEREGRLRIAGCEWAALCAGGCPHERVADGRQAIDGRNVFCTCSDGGAGGYPEIFSHMRRRVEESLSSRSGGFRAGRPSRSTPSV